MPYWTFDEDKISDYVSKKTEEESILRVTLEPFLINMLML